MAVFFTFQFGSQSRGVYKPANQNSEKVLPGNIAILNLTVFVVFKSLPATKSADLISKRMRGQSGK